MINKYAYLLFFTKSHQLIFSTIIAFIGSFTFTHVIMIIHCTRLDMISSLSQKRDTQHKYYHYNHITFLRINN